MNILVLLTLLFNVLTAEVHTSFVYSSQVIIQENTLQNTNSALMKMLQQIYGRGAGGQQQGDLEFISITPPPLNSGTQQVDWVYDNQGRCWSAWSAQKCSLQAHTGGVTVSSMRDFNNDGQEDIECSAGSVSNSTQIKNISNRNIIINCERYSCNACSSGNGTHSQCDGAIDKNADRISESVTLTPGCVATCTMSGAYGTCLEKKDPPPGSSTNDTQDPTLNPSEQNPNPTKSSDSTNATNTPTPTEPKENEITALITNATIEPILKNLIDDDRTPQVDQQQNRVTGTSGFETEIQYVQSLFQKAGITSRIQDASGVETAYINHTCPKDIKIQNLIARIPGKHAGNKYVLTAHLDTKNQNPNQTGAAPGADDNASGVAALIGGAQALVKQRGSLEHTIEFVVFGGNKQGLCGSAYYMDQQKKTEGEIIKGVINLDMIGYPLANKLDCVNFEYKKTQFDDVLSNALIHKRNELAIPLQGISKASDRNDSDHKQFWDQNIPAVLATSCNINPNFNTDSDIFFRSETDYILNVNQIVKTSKIVAATLFDLARAVQTIQPTATSIPDPTATRTIQPSTIPNQNPTPTTRPASQHMPVVIDYTSYKESYNSAPPTYVYAMMNRTYNAQDTTRGIQGLSQINGNVVKMIMISEYNALEQILKNHNEAIKSAGITWIGYNAERDGRTPQSELDAIFSPDASTNTIQKMGKLTDQYGLKLMLGPVTPMWNEFFRRTDRDAGAKAMIGDTCYLDGIAFQEQKQITSTNKAERAKTVAERTAFFRNHAANCPHFESMVQIMSSWCQQNASWEECREYYRLLKNLEGQSKINSIAIWASGEERNELQKFIEFLRK